MNWDQITWGKLSEEDLTMIAGQRDNFSRLLQERFGSIDSRPCLVKSVVNVQSSV